MANKKNGKINYNGKEISFDMAAQLEETNKKLKETLKLQKEHTKELKEQGRISNEIYKKRQEQYNYDNKLQKNMQKELESARQQQKDYISDIENNNRLISRSIANSRTGQSKSSFGLNAWYADYTQQKYNKVYQEIANKQYNSYTENGKRVLTQTEYNRMQNEIEKEFTETLKVSGKNFGKYTEVFKVATDTFNKAVSVWVGVAKAGLNNQSTAFENSFENISVRNNITRGQYYSAQAKTNNILGSLDLRNNIATSEIQNMWNTMANSGLRIDMSTEQARANITANAIDLVLTNKIVPYLNTSSQEFQILNSRIDNKFIKDIRGINLANNEIAGNNFATQELLQTLIDQVQPMSDEALENLAQGSTEVTAMINSLIEAGYSPDAAKSYAVQLFKTQRYSDQVMRSGTLSERMALLDSINSGVNIYNPEDWNDYIGTAVNIDQMIASWTPGYTSTMGGVISNVVGSATIGGDYYSRIWGAKNAQEKGITGTDLINSTNLTPEQIAQFSNRASNSYANDINQTQTQLQNITLENFMNELAVGKQGLGHWTDVIVTAIKGIGTIIMTKIVGGAIGKGIGALAGIGGAGLSSGAGIGAVLGVAGPIALGIGAVAGTVAIINSKIAQQHTEKAEGTTNRIGNMYEQNKNSGMSDVANISDLWNSGQVSDDNGVFENGGETNASFSIREKLPNGHWYDKTTTFENFVNNDKVNFSTQSHAGGSMLEAFSWQSTELRKSLGLTPDWLKSGYDEAKEALDKYGWGGERNAEAYNRIKTFALRSFLNQNQDIPFNYAMAALSAALVLGNHTNDTTITNPLTEYFGQAIVTDKDLLTKTLAANGITESKYLSAIYKILGNRNIDYWLMTNEGGVMTYPTDEQLKSEFNLHRYGLDSVPYDNYPALLHEGEAVLTASTANTLRNLLDEYQQTSTQAVNFDTIIQTQTSALIAKMEEIIVVLTNNSSSNFTTTPEQTNARNILMNSMLHITSTKSF